MVPSIGPPTSALEPAQTGSFRPERAPSLALHTTRYDAVSLHLRSRVCTRLASRHRGPALQSAWSLPLDG